MRIFKAVMAVMLLVALVVPMTALAQEPGSGGPIIQGNFSGSENLGSLNPLRCSGTDCRDILVQMYPDFIGVDADLQYFAPGAEHGIVSDWTISEDGLTYTFTLRDDVYWNDNTPITTADLMFAWDAIQSGEIEADAAGYIDEPGVGVVSVEAPDATTLVVTMAAPLCDALNRIGTLYPVPSHVFLSDPDFEFADMVDHYYDTEPDVTAGRFRFNEIIPGEQVALRYEENYFDAPNGVIPQGFVVVDVPDQTVEIERFLGGELNYIEGPEVARRQDLRDNDAVQYRDYAGNSWDYVGLNLADPTNPQPGLDENDQPIDQGIHPIFGDVRVRRAMQYALNVPEIVDGAVFGEGTQMASSSLPTSWAVNTSLDPIPYDVDAAIALLDEAGWTDSDGDGVRECNGCETAEAGSLLEFNLITNEGNTRRETIAVIVQDQLGQIGFKVNFEAIDFNTLIDNVFGAQTFDAYILGWRNGFPVTPDQSSLFLPASDDPENLGNNSVSYYNPEVTELMQKANNATETNGCDFAARAEIYGQIQEILQADQPYVWLFTQDTMYAANANIENWDARANVQFFNVQDWTISAE